MSDLIAAMRAAQELADSPAVQAAIAAAEKHQAAFREASKHLALLEAVEKNSPVFFNAAKFAQEIHDRQAQLEDMVRHARAAYVPSPEPDLSFRVRQPSLATVPRSGCRTRRANPEPPRRSIVRRELKRRIGFAPFD